MDEKTTPYNGENAPPEPRKVRGGENVDCENTSATKADTSPKMPQVSAWRWAFFMLKFLKSLEQIVVGFYGVAKACARFWWIALVACILIYPAPILEFLAAVIRTIEDIKKLF